MKYKDFISLSKDDMKQIMGGLIEIPNCAVGQCTVFFSETNTTETGYCDEGAGQTSTGLPLSICFCHTPSHTSPGPLTSNGGLSRCSPGQS